MLIQRNSRCPRLEAAENIGKQIMVPYTTILEVITKMENTINTVMNIIFRGYQ